MMDGLGFIENSGIERQQLRAALTHSLALFSPEQTPFRYTKMSTPMDVDEVPPAQQEQADVKGKTKDVAEKKRFEVKKVNAAGHGVKITKNSLLLFISCVLSLSKVERCCSMGLG